MIIRKLKSGWELLITRAKWGWRLAHLGRRSRLGRCRQVMNPDTVSIGDYAVLCDGWFISDLDPARGGVKVRIGNQCMILHEFQINAAVSVEIQDHVLIASRVLVTDSDHVVDPNGERTTLSRELVSAPVVIEHDCWIGQNAVILKGVRIGHHSIVGANAVVTRDVPPCSIVGGVPARVIGSTRRPDGGGGELEPQEAMLAASGYDRPPMTPTQASVPRD